VLRGERQSERAREATRHGGHRDPAARPATGVAGFLDIPGARFEYDASESSKTATDRLFAAPDACMQQAR